MKKVKVIFKLPNGDGWVLKGGNSIFVVDGGTGIWQNKKEFEVNDGCLKIGQTVYFDEADSMFSCSISLLCKITSALTSIEK